MWVFIKNYFYNIGTYNNVLLDNFDDIRTFKYIFLWGSSVCGEIVEVLKMVFVHKFVDRISVVVLLFILVVYYTVLLDYVTV